MVLTPKLLLVVRRSNPTVLQYVERTKFEDFPEDTVPAPSFFNELTLTADDGAASQLLPHRPVTIGSVKECGCCKIVVGYEDKIVVCKNQDVQSSA